MNKSELLEKLKKQGFAERIISAFEKVKRENFVQRDFKELAYDDIALPISEGESISQPSTIAIMLSLLRLHESQRVLEIGSGCGYVLALISEIVGKSGRVFGLEISNKLVEKSIQNIEDYKNIRVFNRNGKNRLSEEAPFERILISAALEKIPEPLFSQLKEGGIIVAPIGSQQMQVLTSIRKKENRFSVLKSIPGFVFVPFME